MARRAGAGQKPNTRRLLSLLVRLAPSVSFVAPRRKKKRAEQIVSPRMEEKRNEIACLEIGSRQQRG